MKVVDNFKFDLITIIVFLAIDTRLLLKGSTNLAHINMFLT